MENLNAEQVKKALECCTSYCDKDNCPYKTHDIPIACMTMRMVDALALIISQEQRIKELTEENEGMISSIKILVNNNANLEFELAQTYDLLEESKADTVRKMQERLKMQWFSDASPHDYDILHSVIDRVAKEMLEGEDG